MTNNDLIDKYFSGGLSYNELLEFEKLYESDTEFKEEMDFLKNIRKVSEKEDSIRFKSTLQGFESEISGRKTPVLLPWIKPLIGAAAVIVITLGIVFLWPSKSSPDNLFATNFQPSKNVSFPVVRSEDETGLLNDAFIVYSEKDYRKAATLFEQLYENNPNPDFLFYEGNALLAYGETAKAIEKFKEHLSFQTTLSERSRWYLALAYLKNKDLVQASNELKTYLDSGETFKQNEAQLLLKKLE